MGHGQDGPRVSGRSHGSGGSGRQNGWGVSVHFTEQGWSLGSSGKVGQKGLKGPFCLKRWARRVRWVDR